MDAYQITRNDNQIMSSAFPRNLVHPALIIPPVTFSQPQLVVLPAFNFSDPQPSLQVKRQMKFGCLLKVPRLKLENL